MISDINSTCFWTKELGSLLPVLGQAGDEWGCWPFSQAEGQSVTIPVAPAFPRKLSETRCAERQLVPSSLPSAGTRQEGSRQKSLPSHCCHFSGRGQTTPRMSSTGDGVFRAAGCKEPAPCRDGHADVTGAATGKLMPAYQGPFFH